MRMSPRRASGTRRVRLGLTLTVAVEYKRYIGLFGRE